MINIIKENENEIKDKNIKDKLNQDDVTMLNKIFTLKKILEQEKLNIKTLKDHLNDISEFNKQQNFDYLQNLINPEKKKGCKIPTQMPIPSCTFQLRSSVKLTTNILGNCAFIFNPFFLYDQALHHQAFFAGNRQFYVGDFMSSFWFNNNENLTGNSENENWVNLDLSQMMPLVYVQYRLVSAAVVVKYIGPIDSACGVVGCSIVTDIIQPGGSFQERLEDRDYDPNGDFVRSQNRISEYGNFDLAVDSYYHKSHPAVYGIRALYYPLDESFENFMPVISRNDFHLDDNVIENRPYIDLTADAYRAGFNWFFYSLGCPAELDCFKVDIYCNFECIPSAGFLTFMPISINPYILSADNKKKIILLTQKKLITKENDENNDEIRIPYIFDRLMKKVGNDLPNIDILMKSGLLYNNSLESGLTLATKMVIDNMVGNYS